MFGVCMTISHLSLHNRLAHIANGLFIVFCILFMLHENITISLWSRSVPAMSEDGDVSVPLRPECAEAAALQQQAVELWQELREAVGLREAQM